MGRKRKVEELPTQVGSLGPEKEIKDLRERLKIEEAKVRALTQVGKTYNVTSKKKKAYSFTISSDWHIGSLYAKPDALLEFIQFATSLGIVDHYAAGDIIEGEKMYKGQEYELKDVGYRRQLNALMAVTEQFPKKAKVHFVTGNHDESFHKQVGVPVGEQIQMYCPNMNFIAPSNGIIIVDTPSGKLRIQLQHPGGGTAYAISYRLQKIIESLEGGNKPHVLAVGHFHKADWLPTYRNVSGFQCGTFQAQTPFMASKASPAHVGGWIVEVILGDLFNRVKAEFISFY